MKQLQGSGRFREHAAAERSMLAQCVTDNNAVSLTAVERILDALWEMLSGVCRRHAIAC
jgi:pyrroloquinoline-quinone synthase